jgi:hypothetical protein
MILAAFALLAAGPAPGVPLTDRAIAAYAARPWDKRALMGRTVVLGTHHGVRVVAEHPCSDVCPDYATRIIHYEVAPGPQCRRIGGLVREAIVPRGIAASRQPFCVPRVLGSQRIRLGDG